MPPRFPRLPLVALLLIGCVSGEPAPSLRPFRTIDPMTDTMFSNPTQFAVGSCAVFVYEHGTGSIAKLDGEQVIARLGRAGDGPGELRHVFALSAIDATAVSAVDWRRGRLVSYSATGALLRDIALTHHAPRHALVGPVIALSNGSLIDAPWGGRTTGQQAHDQVMDTAHLLYMIDSMGKPIRSWGTLVDSTQGRRGPARALQYVGDIARIGDTILYLQFAHPTLHLFHLDTASRVPIRSVDLMRLRPPDKAPAAPERGNLGNQTSFNRARIDYGATSIAASRNGIVAVTLLNPDKPERLRGPEEGGWASEMLVIMRTDGRLIRQFQLDGRGTRSAAFLKDGTYLRRYFADSTGASGTLIGYYKIPGVTQEDDFSCDVAAETKRLVTVRSDN